MDAPQLLNVLAALPALELRAVTLLRQGGGPLSNTLPDGVSRADVAAAVLEVAAYTDACRGFAHRLNGLAPVPLAVEHLEYGL